MCCICSVYVHVLHRCNIKSADEEWEKLKNTNECAVCDPRYHGTANRKQRKIEIEGSNAILCNERMIVCAMASAFMYLCKMQGVFENLIWKNKMTSRKKMRNQAVLQRNDSKMSKVAISGFWRPPHVRTCNEHSVLNDDIDEQSVEH